MEYPYEVVFPDIQSQPLERKYIKRQKMMKVGRTSKLCPVCLENFQKDTVIYKLPCKHIFHQKCLIPWLERKCYCPNCKNDLYDHFLRQDREEYI